MVEKRLTGVARELRNCPTDAEQRLWTHLRSSQLRRAKFVRQHQIGDFVVDFACRSLRIAIECDGGQHCAHTDAARTAHIEAHGYRIIGFWNHDVLENTDGVLATIAREIEIARNA
ncbi:DUF559 domain-containing protein [Citromicrobium bathyomarinum]